MDNPGTLLIPFVMTTLISKKGLGDDLEIFTTIFVLQLMLLLTTRTITISKDIMNQGSSIHNSQQQPCLS